MLFYYLRLSALSYRRNPMLSSLMVLSVAIAIGAYMVIFTLNYVMGGNPIPHKSDQLFHVEMDIGNPSQNFDPPVQLTYLDSMALIRDGRAFRQTMS